MLITVETLLLIVLCAISLLAYMIAINSRGPTRLSLSYLLATIILATTVWSVVQFVNQGQNVVQSQRLKELENEKLQYAQELKAQEEKLAETREKKQIAITLTDFINKATKTAASIMNADLHDRSATLDQLIGRANIAQSSAKGLKDSFEQLNKDHPDYQKPVELIEEALNELGESAYYYRLYYRSEDSNQEAARARILRSKARSATNKLQEASGLIAKSS